jgi:hypothetical protein
VRTTVDLDPELAQELADTRRLTREKQASIIRLALRVGLPLVRNRYQAPRPEGYFASDYQRRQPERDRLEKAMLRVKHTPER